MNFRRSRRVGTLAVLAMLLPLFTVGCTFSKTSADTGAAAGSVAGTETDGISSSAAGTDTDGTSESSAPSSNRVFISQFFYNGKVYEYLFQVNTPNETFQLAASSTAPEAVVSTFAGTDAVLDSELETNDGSLVGAGILRAYPNEINPDSLVIDRGGSYLVYGSESGNPNLHVERITFSSEDEFRQSIKDSLTKNGFTEISPEDWQSQYNGTLVSFSSLPDQYQYFGTVFVKADPGIPSQTMTAQVWYDADALEVIRVTQEYAPDRSDDQCFVFSDHDEDGFSLQCVHPWANYLASYQTNLNGTSVNAVMLLVNSGREAACEKILTSLQIAS